MLHPVQAASADPVVRGSGYDMGTCTASVPGRTAAVFWERRPVDEQLDLLIGEVAKLVAAGVLNHGQARSLIAKLENAQRQVQAGKPGPARNMIQAFINQVQDLAAGGNPDGRAGRRADPRRRGGDRGPRLAKSGPGKLYATSNASMSRKNFLGDK